MSSIDSILIPLHDSILECMELIQKVGSRLSAQKENFFNFKTLQEATKEDSNLSHMIPAIFRQLLVFSKFACQPPTLHPSIADHQHVHHHQKYSKTTNHYGGNNNSIEVVSMNYIPFGEKSINICVKLYQTTATEESVMQEHILHEIIKVDVTQM